MVLCGGQSGMKCVITVRSPGKPFDPGPWSITCDTPEVHGNDFVDHFRLVIHLRMKRRTHSELDAC
jgi:hypothetical protein